MVDDGQAAGEAVGTAVIISTDGEIVTNNYVVAGGGDVHVRGVVRDHSHGEGVTIVVVRNGEHVTLITTLAEQ